MFRIFGFAIVFAALSQVRSAHAADILVEGNTRNSGVTIALTPEMAGKKIAVVAAAPNRETQTVQIAVEGPIGTKVSAKGFTLKGSEKVKSLYNAGQGDALTLFSLYSGRAAASMSVGGTSTQQVTSGDTYIPNCGCLPLSVIQMQQQFIPNFCERVPHFLTCEGSGSSSSSGGGGELSGGVIAKTFVSINKCLSKSKAGVAVVLDLTDVAATDLAGNAKVVTTFKGWDGNKRASIKPRSDGMFAPQPLLLTGPVYGGGDEGEVRLLLHSSKRVRKNTKIMIRDSINYRGQSYWRLTVGGQLRGGKGTFQMKSGAEGYSICAKLSASRQRFNGYQN